MSNNIDRRISKIMHNDNNNNNNNNNNDKSLTSTSMTG